MANTSGPRRPGRTDEKAGRGEVDLSMNDIRDAYGISSGGRDKTKKFIDSALFEGITAGTRREFEEAMRTNRRTVEADEILTRHSAEIPGSSTQSPSSPLNPLWVQDRALIKANLYDLPDSPEAKSKKQLGGTSDYEVLGLRGWFAGAADTPIAILPGLQVRSATKQTVTRIPSLAQMQIPEKDLARLMYNTAGLFSRLLSADNSADIVREPGYRPHQVPNMVEAEARAFSGVPGVREVRLGLHEGFTPAKNLSGPHAIVLSGEGVFVNKSDAATHRGRDFQAMLEAGVVPLAQLGNPEERSATNEALAFQWVGLNSQRNDTSAVFFATKEGSTARYVPLQDDLTLHLLALNSIAGTAASMHRHVGSLEANQGFFAKAGKRLAGLRGLLGF